jgi:UDP-N-acetylmuramate dehydrogenase
MEILINYNLKKLNTLAIEHYASYFVNFNNENDIEDILLFLKEHSISRKMFLGSGSNLLFSKNYDGLIIKNGIKGIRTIFENEQYAIVEVGAGEIWDDFVKYTIQQNLFGLENLAMIPGTVGAAPVQNIGAYGTEQSNCLFEIFGYNFTTQKFENYTFDECKFGYRDSIFKSKLKDQFLIIKVRYKLNKSFIPNIAYKDLRNYFEKNQIELTAENIYNAVCEIRDKKLPNPRQIPNAGSFFKNPIINKTQLNELLARFPDLPYFEMDAENFKLPAAYLIEKAGWKGKSIGQAGIFANHSLILINLGDANSKEILNLAFNIIESIEILFNIHLEFEVNII